MLTPMLNDIAIANGGQLEGLEYRFKSMESLEFKVINAVRSGMRNCVQSCKNASNMSLIECVIQDIGDALRYTIVIPIEKYCEVVKSTRLTMKESVKVQLLKLKNYWEPGGWVGR